MLIKKHIETSALYLIEKFCYFVNPFILNFAKERDGILIFYLHGLYESKKEKELNYLDPQNNLLVSQFVDLVEYFLHNNYSFIKPEDLLSELPPGKRRVMMTFDDGYFNNSLAIDVLNKYQIPATFFITARNVLKSESFWWDIIYRNRIKEGKSLNDIRREQAYLKRYKCNFIENYIEKQFGKKSKVLWGDISRPFNTDELRLISRNPLVTIGNHTYNHSILTNNDVNEVREEINSCNNFLREITGITPNAIAFPNGNFNDKVLNVAQQEGIQMAFTIENKLNHLPILRNKIVCLNRFSVMPMNARNYVGLNQAGFSPYSLFQHMKKKLAFFAIPAQTAFIVFIN